MKAVSIALCVALAGHAAANIFYSKYQPAMDALVMQPSDYVDQYQPQYETKDHYQMQKGKRYQPQYETQEQYQMQQDKKYQPQYETQEQYQMQQDKKYQPQYEIPEQYKMQKDKKNQPKYQMKSDKKYKPQYQMQSESSYQSQEQYQPQYQTQEQYQPQYQMQSEQKSQMTKYQKQQKAIRSKKQRKPVDSGEAMSEERGWGPAMPTAIPHAQPWTQPWTQPMIADADRVIEAAPAYGDAITWRDIQIADGPNSPVTDKKELERIFEDAYETMEHIKPEDKHAIHTAIEAALHDHDSYLQAQMNASQLIRSHGFTVAEHTVTTADGYLLSLLRVAAPSSAATGAPVLLMPGLLGGAEDWLLMGPQHSLAFLLAGAGRDVWLGTFRGGRGARAHVSLHPAMEEFWHFSVDDLALRDLPALLEHVLAESGRPALHLVGHSLGAAAALELLAAEPARQAQVAGVYALAPLLHTGGARSPLLRMLNPASGFGALLAAQLGEGRFRPTRGLLSSVGGALLQAELGCANVSASARLVISGAHVHDAAAATAAARALRAEDATSVRVLRQLAAAVPAFARYDHGARVNRLVYGAATAPAVEPARVAVPVLLVPAAADWLAAPEDVRRLAQQLPGASLRTLPDAHATGLDLLFSERVADQANQIVMQAIADAIAAEPAGTAIAAEPASSAVPAPVA